MNLNELSPKEGSKRKAFRVGRGHAFLSFIYSERF